MSARDRTSDQGRSIHLTNQITVQSTHACHDEVSYRPPDCSIIIAQIQRSWWRIGPARLGQWVLVIGGDLFERLCSPERVIGSPFRDGESEGKGDGEGAKEAS